jgi:hypothetical protein
MSADNPRFRRDLLVTPFEADGQAYVEVRDPTSDVRFTFYDFEYCVALAFDGLPLDKIIPWVKLSTGLELDRTQLEAFAARLGELGFLDGVPASSETPDPALIVTPDPVSPHAIEPSLTLEPSAPEEAAASEQLEGTESAAPPTEPPPVEPAAPVAPPAEPPPAESPVAESAAPPTEPPPVEPAAPVAPPAEPPPAESSLAEPAEPPAEPPPVTVPSADVAPADAAPAEPPPAEPPPAESSLAEPAEPPAEPPPVTALSADVAPADVAPADAPPTEAPPAPDQVSMDADVEAELPPDESSELRVALSEEAGVVIDEFAPLEAAEASDPRIGAGSVEAGDPASEDVAPAPVSPAQTVSEATVASPAQQPASEPAARYAPVDAPKSPPAVDSPAFPVLPVSSTRPAAVESPTPSAPPTWATPRPFMTPAPVTFGPSLLADQPSGRRRAQRSLLIFGSLGVLAAVAVLAIVLAVLLPSSGQRPRSRVRVQAVAPGTVYRYFDGQGNVAPVPGALLRLPIGGKVIRLVAANSTVTTGEVLAAVDSARALLTQLARQRERLAFAEQMAEGMHQAGNTAEEGKQAAKVQARRDQIAETLRMLDDKAIVATRPAVVEQTFVHEGDVVEAHSPALRLRSIGYEVRFTMSPRDSARARRMAFCQVEVDGYLFGCSPVDDASAPADMRVAIASVPPQVVGKSAHLARARFEGAVVLPSSVFVPGARRDEVLVVTPAGRLESRPVTVAEREPGQAIVVQGLDGGDKVVLEVSERLHAGDLVTLGS